MAQVLMKRVLVNPGTRKKGRGMAKGRRKLSLKQKLFFGTPAQRAAARSSLKNRGRRRRVKNPLFKTKAEYERLAKTIKHTKRRGKKRTASVKRRTGVRKRLRYSGKLARYQGHAAYRYVVNPRRKKRKASSRKRTRRVRNVGQILTYSLGNPGGRRRKRKGSGTMARRKRTRRASARRVTRRRRRNPSLASLKRALGVGTRRRRYSRRRRNSGMRRRHHRRRRNSGVVSGVAGNTLGLIAGATVVQLVSTKLIPGQYQAGFMGVVSTALVALAGGYLATRFGGASIGSAVRNGGYVVAALKALQEVGLASYSSLGLRGAYSQSNFFNPQVQIPGSVTQFYRPMAIPAPAPVALRGRTGRLA